MQELHKPIDLSARLFTIFCRRDEAVHVSQFAARDVKAVVDTWILRELPSVVVETEEAAAISHELRSDEPGLVQGCVNVWVVTAFPVWLDIVETSTEARTGEETTSEVRRSNHAESTGSRESA